MRNMGSIVLVLDSLLELTLTFVTYFLLFTLQYTDLAYIFDVAKMCWSNLLVLYTLLMIDISRWILIFFKICLF